MSRAAVILIAEDEAAIATLIKYNLEQAGYKVIHALDGETALRLARQEKPDVVLLDWMLPVMSGLEVCRQLRAYAETERLPIMMLTARADEADRVKGLHTGADDYLAKPFSPGELLARIHALLRRAGVSAVSSTLLSCADLSMDTVKHTVTRGGRTVHLGPTEYKMLQQLLQQPGKVLSRDDLLENVWGKNIHVEERTIDVHIRRLRKALNEGGEPDLIRTVRSAGYALSVPSMDDLEVDAV
ncbi:MAG: phosphate regulon transcriptional regulator PhoB [Holosporales bacterium]